VRVASLGTEAQEGRNRKDGMDELQLRARIRSLICTDSIAAIETEFEVDLSSGTRLRVHRRCYYLWLEECSSLSA
jgi:hypothetical protein